MRETLRPILAPSSLAVVGASRTPGTIGHEIVASLLRCGYTGAVYPVNPKAAAICAVPAFPSIEAIPAAIDQAIIVVPKELVQGVVESCARKGIPGLVVISSGFKEVGGRTKPASKWRATPPAGPPSARVARTAS